MRHPLRMPDRVGDRNRAPLGDAEQREPLNARGVDHRFEIVHEPLECDVRDLTVRQPIAPRVVSDESVLAGQFLVEMPPDRTFEIEFDVGHPVPGLDQRSPWPIRA